MSVIETRVRKVRDRSLGDEGAVIFAMTFPPDVRDEAEAFLKNGGSLEEAIRKFLLRPRQSLNSSAPP